jgi:serine/threonine protein kinase
MESGVSTQGICPHCEGVGPIGERCLQKVCRKRGYCFIPGDYFAGSHATEVDPFLGRRIGDYLVVELIGTGGFGKVYLALQLPIMMKAALKLLDLEGLDDEMRKTVLEKFEGEARALARLTHPNIVRLLQYGRYEKMPFLVMEYVDGGVSLTEEMDERSEADLWFMPGEIRRIIGQLLDALEAAHGAQIVHRDLKPDNLMLQQAPGHPDLLRVLDFGLAKYVGGGSSTKTAMGTPEFVAPEVLSGKNIGPWTDLYSVGALVYELLSDRLPFSTESVDVALGQKLDPTYDPVELLADLHLSTSICAFLRKALARRPQNRFRNAAAFRQAFRAALDTLPADFSLGVSQGPDGARSAEKNARPANDTADGTANAVPKSGDVIEKTVGAESAQRNEIQARIETDGEQPRHEQSRAAFKRWLQSEKERLDRQERALREKGSLPHVAFSAPSLNAFDAPDEGGKDGET